jgi:hypothetical protein
LTTLSAKRKYIQNDYAYINLYINNGKLKESNIPKNFPKYPKIRLHIKNTSNTETSKIIKQLQDKYNITETVLN